MELLGLYILLIALCCLVAYAGWDATMRLFAFLDLHLRYSWIKFKMSLMRRRLERDLRKDNANFDKLIKEINDDDRS
jgi:hypothetical protein